MKKNEEIEVIDEEISCNKKIIYYIFISLALISFVTYAFIEITRYESFLNFLPKMLGLVFIFLVLICLIIMTIRMKEKRISIIIISVLFILYSAFNILLTTGKISLPSDELIPNFYNKSLTEVNKWKEKNHIDIIENYEHSDTIEKYYIISQDMNSPTLTKDITKLTIIISLGPDLEKEVIIPNFVGLTRDEVIKYAEENYLSNVEFTFTDSDKQSDTIISQSNSGTMKRNDKIVLTISKNKETEVKIIDFTNHSKMYALSWLESYGFKVKIEEEYNENVKQGYVIKQNVKDEVKNALNDEIILTISKGKMIKAPDINSMSQDEINEWIINNNLKVSYKEEYSDTISLGDIIDSTIKEGDIINANEKIEITISKGSLEMIEFTNLNSFINWAESNKVSYDIKYENSNSVKKDDLIKASHKKGETIKKDDTIILTISSGKSITVPYFIGMNRNTIQSKCNELNLSCSFKTGNYTENTQKDIAIAQSRNSGTTVSEGTNLIITLSAGIIEKVNVPNFVNQNKNSIDSQCKNIGINCNYTYQNNFSDIAKDICVNQSATGKVNKGSTITITLSKGPAQSYNVIIDANQLSSGNPQATKATLEGKLKNAYPDVNFVFKFEKANSGIGYLSPNSDIKVGNNTLVQGRTYNVIINSN